MAIVKFGATVVGARGTMGGLTFSANHSGPYIKSWNRSANMHTVKQGLQRNSIGSMAARWKDANNAQKAGWNTYAAQPGQELTNALGEPYFASGWNWFAKMNAATRLVGRSTTPIPPTDPTPTASAASSVDVFHGAIGTSELTLASGEYDSLDLVVFTTYSTSTGRIASTLPRQLFLTAQTPGDGAINISDQLTDLYGRITNFAPFWFFLYRQNLEGRRASPEILFTTAHA